MHTPFFTCCTFLISWMMNCYGHPLQSTKFNSVHLKDISYGEEKEQFSTACEYLDLNDVEFLEEGHVLVKAYNTTMAPFQSYIFVDNEKICFNRSDDLKNETLSLCTKWKYDPYEFEILQNGSVVLLSPVHSILEPGTYEIVKDDLHTCMIDEDYPENSTFVDKNGMIVKKVSIMFGKVGGFISIVALAVHLIIFCVVPTLRNLPGYNLASLSAAFLIAYLSVIVGQLPSVLGVACVLSGIVQLYCFLVAFFCTNVMAFDVWRSLRLATSKLTVSSLHKKKIQFIIYSVYSWGSPMLITITVVMLDNIDGVPSWLKPGIGDNRICWMNNKSAKIIFFSVPAFTLFLINGIFFVLSAAIIKNNTMKNISDQHNQATRINLTLYIRLGLMMGVTWLFSVLATLIDSTILWLISDFLNSLQGLFIFLLFTCSRKVLNYLKQRINLRTPKNSTNNKKSCLTSDKNMTSSITATNKLMTFSNLGQLGGKKVSNSSATLAKEMSFPTPSLLDGEPMVDSSIITKEIGLLSPILIDSEAIKDSSITKEIMLMFPKLSDGDHIINFSIIENKEITDSPPK